MQFKLVFRILFSTNNLEFFIVFICLKPKCVVVSEIDHEGEEGEKDNNPKLSSPALPHSPSPNPIRVEWKRVIVSTLHTYYNKTTICTHPFFKKNELVGQLLRYQ